jgi:RNA polymerase sigma-70 factor (ECF subfamily)
VREEPPLPSDEDLAARYVEAPRSPAGRGAAEELFARYDTRIYHWCLRLSREHEAALDLAQEAMLTALRDLHQFQGHSRFSTWLYAVVRRRSLRLLQRERRWLIDDVDEEGLISRAPDPADEVAGRDEEEWVRATMRDVLEPIEATALVLRCEEGLPVDEITRVLHLTGASGARGVLQSARRKLRAALEARRAGEGGGA